MNKLYVMSGVIRSMINAQRFSQIKGEYQKVCEEGVELGVLKRVKRCFYREKPIINGRKKPGPRKKKCYDAFEFTDRLARLPRQERQKYYEAVYVVNYIVEQKGKVYLEGRLGRPNELLPEFLRDRLIPEPGSKQNVNIREAAG